MKRILVSLVIGLLSFHLKAELDCSRFNDLRACLYKPKELRSKTLLVYLRGHFEGEKPPHPSSKTARKRSLEECVKTYGLQSMAEDKGMMILLTSVATVSFSSSELKDILDEYQLEEVVLASHSGSFRAMNKQLASSIKIKDVYLLDNFYGDTSIAKELGDFIEDENLNCRGFLTSHNKDRYTSRYKDNIKCQVESGSSFNHFTSVGKCLPFFIDGKACR